MEFNFSNPMPGPVPGAVVPPEIVKFDPIEASTKNLHEQQGLGNVGELFPSSSGSSGDGAWGDSWGVSWGDSWGGSGGSTTATVRMPAVRAEGQFHGSLTIVDANGVVVPVAGEAVGSMVTAVGGEGGIG